MHEAVRDRIHPETIYHNINRGRTLLKIRVHKAFYITIGRVPNFNPEMEECESKY